MDIYREREHWVMDGFIPDIEIDAFAGEEEPERCAGCGQFKDVHQLVNGYCAERRNINGE
ncbi:MAG: hypothetical protein IMZ53_00400 [Thermoplasmata archaeon]|nr:hypothetical protein [Thermoplasmata archaeon]